jgi:nitrogen fixation protein FixH
MKQAANAPTQGEFTGRHMLLIMLAFFGIVIGVNAYLAVLASRTFTGLVVANSYVASQTFDKDTAKLVADSAMDIRPLLTFVGGRVHLKFESAAGEAIDVKEPRLTLGHAVSSATDHQLMFSALGRGEFEAQATLGSGFWQGNLVSTLPNGASWERPIRLEVK